ncbi:hypothetical protein OH76DRAFT_616121 [Lentinus brumalis]|uniref:Uncharacterized protein n=1 Tax=Lentinus brumalis TaxID=2498619 RepID=A0A371D8U9_9APHY|nr:hypothetical protein OH76DRAFT_616121 [Polyporus brumalis]
MLKSKRPVKLLTYTGGTRGQTKERSASGELEAPQRSLLCSSKFQASVVPADLQTARDQYSPRATCIASDILSPRRHTRRQPPCSGTYLVSASASLPSTLVLPVLPSSYHMLVISRSHTLSRAALARVHSYLCDPPGTSTGHLYRFPDRYAYIQSHSCRYNITQARLPLSLSASRQRSCLAQLHLQHSVELWAPSRTAGPELALIPELGAHRLLPRRPASTRQRPTHLRIREVPSTSYIHNIAVLASSSAPSKNISPSPTAHGPWETRRLGGLGSRDSLSPPSSTTTVCSRPPDRCCSSGTMRIARPGDGSGFRSI